jgi:hypothetical protein
MRDAHRSLPAHRLVTVGLRTYASGVASALAEVPDDLRHAGISLGLRMTRDAALIAERAGQGVAVLMERYAWALDDSDAAANKAVEEGLGDDWRTAAGPDTRRESNLIPTVGERRHPQLTASKELGRSATGGAKVSLI